MASVNVWRRRPVAKASADVEAFVQKIEARAAALAARGHADAATAALAGVEATGAEAVTLARARGIIAKAAATPMRDALVEVWREDPALYEQYRRERPAAPRTGARPASRRA